MIVLTSAKNGVFTIRLNRPDAKNAMDAAMYEHCTAALKDAGAREDVLVVVFTGARRIHALRTLSLMCMLNLPVTVQATGSSSRRGRTWRAIPAMP